MALSSISTENGITDIGSQTLTVFGRSLYVPWASSGVCKFSFSELCDQVCLFVLSKNTNQSILNPTNR